MLFFRKFFPTKNKEKRFYPLYVKQADLMETASGLLVELLKEESFTKRKEIAKEIKQLESKGDAIADQIFDELYKTTGLLLDKVDFHLLASKVETFLDFINDSAKVLVIYQPSVISKDWQDMVDAIYEDAKIICGLIKEINDIRAKYKYLLQKCLRIKEIEHEVDDIYETFMSNLFQTEKDPIEVIKYKNIAQNLEDTTDKAKEISDTVKSIIIKHTKRN